MYGGESHLKTARTKTKTISEKNETTVTAPKGEKKREKEYLKKKKKKTKKKVNQQRKKNPKKP